jgi:signal peptidase I
MNGDHQNSELQITVEQSVLRTILRGFRDVLETIVPAILIALLINLFMAQATRVYGQSMEPNLHTDERVIVEKISYHFHAPRRGDVVVLRVSEQSSELLIKRVVGLPGDQVEIHNGNVLINGKPLAEPYLRLPTSGQFGPIDIPPLHVFVLGDNRGFSNDSRSFGTVALNEIVGKAWFAYWPPGQLGFINK